MFPSATELTITSMSSLDSPVFTYVELITRLPLRKDGMITGPEDIKSDL